MKCDVRAGNMERDDMDTAICTEQLRKSFVLGNNRIEILKGINIEIAKGHLTIIKGRSGSGKTTLLNILSALDEPTGGKVEFLGNNLAEFFTDDKEELRSRRMGFVFQSIALVPVMSAYENVDFALRLAGYEGDRDKRIKELMERVGLRARMHHMANQLSGGEQQRVAIARAVAHHPEVIFADEPTGALDTASGLAVMELFAELIDQEGATIVMTTHDPNLMEFGDEVYEIADGEIIKSGSAGSQEKLWRGGDVCGKAGSIDTGK